MSAADAEHCVTCSDMAVEVRVVRRLPDLMAVVDTGQGEETVSVALVDVAAGDRILVHAGEAIIKLTAPEASGGRESAP